MREQFTCSSSFRQELQTGKQSFRQPVYHTYTIHTTTNGTADDDNASHLRRITLPGRLGKRENSPSDVVRRTARTAHFAKNIGRQSVRSRMCDQQPTPSQTYASLPSAQWGGCKEYHPSYSGAVPAALRGTLTAQAVSGSVI